MGSGAGLRGQQGCEGFADVVLDSEQAPIGLKNRIAVTILARARLTIVFILFLLERKLAKDLLYGAVAIFD